jgi:KipI family sensor histidine kinase inhibitor
MTLAPLGDSAVVLSLGDVVDDTVTARVQAVAHALQREPLPGIVDIVPAFATVTVVYAIAQIRNYAAWAIELQQRAAAALPDAGVAAGNVVEIPTCYGGEYGPDLEEVAQRAGLTPPAVIELHAGGSYRVQAIGFVPGFVYLGGLPGNLHTPRRTTPRVRIDAGAVGIGGAQTGVYPVATPGGWNIIGRTPLRMFDPQRTPPARLQAGDRVKFCAISATEFTDLEQTTAAHTSAAPSMSEHARERGGLASVRVIRAGMQTTIQDLGRPGFRAIGVPLSGAADPFALRLANLLVGNPENTAALEFALLGPEIEFSHDTLIALTGADFGRVPRWRPLRVRAGSRLRLGSTAEGCRGYLAIAGGFAVDPVLGSASTFLRGMLGGLEGRALRDGDVLPVHPVIRQSSGHWHIDDRVLPAYSHSTRVRVIAGAQASEFPEEFYTATYQVTGHSDRMGVRLSGASLPRASTTELRSAPVVPGVVQVPPDGQPIVLLADAQTIGGYPQIAHVITIDLPLMAQLRPGDTVQFAPVTLAEAHELALAREHALAMLRQGLAQKLG